MKINLWKLCVFQDCEEYHLLNMVHDKK